MAKGDRQLVTSRGERDGLAAAASAYRQAAAAAKDDPNIHLRHAITLTALGRDKEAVEATGRAVRLDGRLAAQHRGVDPAATAPAVARGMAILREIAATAAADDEVATATIEMLADRWTGQPKGPLAAMAAGGSTPR